MSFDVSIFTNVPTELAVDVAHKQLEEDEKLIERTVLEVEEIVMLLQLCLDATFVCFMEKYYRHTFRTAMGSPVSVTIANQSPPTTHPLVSERDMSMIRAPYSQKGQWKTSTNVSTTPTCTFSSQ